MPLYGTASWRAKKTALALVSLFFQVEKSVLICVLRFWRVSWQIAEIRSVFVGNIFSMFSFLEICFSRNPSLFVFYALGGSPGPSLFGSADPPYLRGGHFFDVFF